MATLDPSWYSPSAPRPHLARVRFTTSQTGGRSRFAGKATQDMQLTGSQALIKALEMEGVDTIFGLPGGCILPVYDPLLDSPIRHILVRHEQGAGHMAEGYAHVTGRPGVAMVTSGPGGHQHRHAALRRLHGLDPDGRHHRPGAGRPPSAPTPSRSATRSASPGRSPSTTSWSPRRPTSPVPCGRRSTSPPPAGPGPCCSTSPRTSSTRRTRTRPWSGTGPTTPTCATGCPATSPPPRATRARSARRPS